MYLDCKKNRFDSITATPTMLIKSLEAVGGSNVCLVSIGKFYYPAAGTAGFDETPETGDETGVFYQQCTLNKGILDTIKELGVSECPEPPAVFSKKGLERDLQTGELIPNYLWQDAVTMRQPYAERKELFDRDWEPPAPVNKVVNDKPCFSMSDEDLAMADTIMPDLPTTGFPLLLITSKVREAPQTFPPPLIIAPHE